MHRSVVGATVALVLAFATTAAFATYDTGHIGIYSDAAGTQACAQIEPGTYSILYVIATIGMDFRGDLSGVEFRIEVTHPEGWYVAFMPTADGILIGDPIDVHPADRHDDSGANLAFLTCQHPDANAQVSLGTLFVQNVNGAPTELLVNRRSQPLNNGYPCALFVNCDAPQYGSTCNTPALPSSCTQFVVPHDPNAGGECDTPYFVMTLNQEVDARWTAPPTPRYVGGEVIAMVTRRSLIELRAGQAAAPLDSATIRSVGLREALYRHGVERVAKFMPCFDLADTVAVTSRGDTVRLMDWSLLWIFELRSAAHVHPLIDDLEHLPRDIVYAEGNGYAVPDGYSVSQFSAPNPLIQKGTLRLRVSQPTQGRIEIFDASGRRVKVVVDRLLAAGPNDFLWDGTDGAGNRLPSGVYFAHVVAEGHSATHKLVLLR